MEGQCWQHCNSEDFHQGSIIGLRTQEPLSISELEILHEVQAKVNELAVAETLEVPSSPVSVGSNRTDTETVDLFWSDASVSGSD